MLVTVRLIAAKMEVAVNSLNAIAQTAQHKKQCHTVGTAAERHKIFAVGGEQFVGSDIVGNCLI